MVLLPGVALQAAATVALIVPLVLVMPVTVIPVGIEVAVTVKLPAAVSASLTVAIVTAAPAGLLCCRVRVAAGVMIGLALGGEQKERPPRVAAYTAVLVAETPYTMLEPSPLAVV